ncbi:DUF4083 family protein [Oikeobacillus pervagus]|uniref:DUF4083 family protein n=1 Tax=Oikeobacillus pervagus TaxID=1325931 RepID=UPI00352294F9
MGEGGIFYDDRGYHFSSHSFCSYWIICNFIYPFIRRLLVNSTNKNSQIKELGEKLDKIIEILEKDNNNH